MKELEGWGVAAKPHPWVPGCLELTGAGDLTTLAPFREGKLLVQDPAARLVSLIAGVQPGQRCWISAPLPAANPSAPPLPWRTRGRLSPATSTKTS